MATVDQKRSRSLTKSPDDQISIQTSAISRMKRKASLTNSDEIIQTITKKLDAAKSAESEPKDQKSKIEPDASTVNDRFDRENDADDYADRIFNYLGEACAQPPTSSLLPQVEINQIHSSAPSIIPAHTSDNEIKPLLCTFCPYFTRNFPEFQTHIAKHTEKNFRCLLCNCMYKYRRDCVTHMKRKHSNTVTGSISQYIEKINDTARNVGSIQPSSSTPNNLSSCVEPKRYGCPYCSLMTKSTSSIYKHQSRKHASFPKIVHKYSSDDPNTRSLVAILKQKSVKKPISLTDESVNPNDLPDPSNVSSSSSFAQQNTDSSSLANRHRCAASKHVTAHHVPSSTDRQGKVFQCCLCGYRAHHRSNVVRHVKKIHTIDVDEANLSANIVNNETALIENIPSEHFQQSDDHCEQIPNYSFNTTVQAPLTLRHAEDPDQLNKPYADIHLSINIFLPKKMQQNSFIRTMSDCSNSEEKLPDFDSDEDLSDTDEITKIHLSSSQQQNSLYKPHKCRRCFYRSNWKTDMLHHIRLKHHINHATKCDYISMDLDSALRSFSNYEKTFGKVLKNRLLLPKIDYIDCSWEEFKSKLSLRDDVKQINRPSSPSVEGETTLDKNTLSSMNNKEKNLLLDNHQ